MPAFVFHIPIDLNKLFEDGTAATSALGGKPRGIVEVAVDIAIMFIIRILRSEESRTQ
jgi:hypothetical protein